MWQSLKNLYHLVVALLANIRYGFPSRKITVIGITGTDGKTTTTSLIYHILKHNKKRVSAISTVGAIIGGENYDLGFHVTNPDSFPLQAFIKKALPTSDYLVLEVTSHGLDQNRVFGIKFDVSVLTNITHEHLDYHKTYEKYVDAKLKLFKNSKISVLNLDDQSYKYVAPHIDNKVTYSLHNKKADITLDTFSFKTHLVGNFNKKNILAATLVCKQLGLTDKEIQSAILSFNPPLGRQELVYDKEFKVMIDFAHTPNSFLEILPQLKEQTSGRLIHVFGSAGKRDNTKRPFMGEASSKYADILIVTAEDPRGEPVEKITDDILQGVTDKSFNRIDIESEKIDSSKKYIIKIPDRKKAIEFAINIAKKGDYIVTTGKSHEKSMNYGNGEEPWSEHEVVFNAIKKKEVNNGK